LTDYPIPDAALDDRLGFIGTSGSGKTYNAGSGVERLLASGARVVIVDPLGVWWGLRLLADGKTPSPFNVAIFGGPHGDLPLNEHAGALLGETAATMTESCIIDLSELGSKSADRRFMSAFLETVFRKANGDPFHLIVDEADLFAPQKPGKGDEVLLGHMENIVRRGRVRGFIPWLISQRPAVLNKNVLSQVDGLVAFMLTASQDRKPLGDWVSAQADEGQWPSIYGQLPTLPIGTGVVWLPRRSMLETVKFPRKLTFDSSATPKRGEKRQRRDLKPLDLGKLKDRLATVEEEAKANDPRALKAEIAALKRQVAMHHNQIATDATTDSNRLSDDLAHALAEQQKLILANAQCADFITEQMDEIAELEKQRDHYKAGFEDYRERIKKASHALGYRNLDELDEEDWEEGLKPAKVQPRPAAPTPQRRAAPAPAPVQRQPAPVREPRDRDGDGEVPAGCAKPLAALAAVYPSGLTEPQWATSAGYKRSGGTWGTYKSRLRGAGLIEPRDGRWFATEAGAQAAGDVELPPSPGPDLVRWWAAKLPGTAKVAEALIEAWPHGLTKDDLAERIGMSASGGSFGTYLSRLAGPGLIDRSGGLVQLSPDVMG
jgi:hypothetical protein